MDMFSLRTNSVSHQLSSLRALRSLCPEHLAVAAKLGDRRVTGEGSVALMCSSPRPPVMFGASGAWGTGVKVAPDSKPEKALQAPVL